MGEPDYGPVERTYYEPDADEGFLYVREWEDHRLETEWRFLLNLLHAVTSELAFRGDNPEHRDDTGLITADYSELYELADTLASHTNRPGEPIGPQPDVDRD